MTIATIAIEGITTPVSRVGLGRYWHKAAITTKVALKWHDGAVFDNSSPERIRQEVEATLRRLRTDYIDLYRVHWPDRLVPIEEIAAVLDDLRKRVGAGAGRKQLLARRNWMRSGAWRRYGHSAAV